MTGEYIPELRFGGGVAALLGVLAARRPDAAAVAATAQRLYVHG